MDRTGEFHCFCKNLLDKYGVDRLSEYKFPLDQGTHCEQWFTTYLIVLTVVGAVAGMIILGNVAVEGAVTFGAAMTRPINEQRILFNAIKAISWVQFINLGCVLLMINVSITIADGAFALPGGLLQGDYEDFTCMWYVNVGTQIILAMVLEVGAPHFLPAWQRTLYGCRRSWDRGCSCDRRRSKKLIQSDYEELYIGPEFALNARFAQIVAVIWVTFMYSPALPVLFPLAAVNFTLIFWVDKYLLLRFYRTPKNYDEQAIQHTLGQLKYAFLFHFVIGALVYSNRRILSSSGTFAILGDVINQVDKQEGDKGLLEEGL